MRMRALFAGTFLAAGLLSSGGGVALAQREAHPVDALQLDGAIVWTSDGAVFRDGRRAKRRLSAEERKTDRAALIDRAIERAGAEHKLVLWYIPRIIENHSQGRQMYRAPVLDLYMRQVVFADEDVAALITSRFVPLRCVCDETLSERFGLRPLEFIEPAVVFLDGQGKIVHFVQRIRTFDALWFDALARRVLARAGLRAEKIAAASAGAPDSAGQLIERAAAARRLRRPEEALKLLDRAQEALGDLKLRARRQARPRIEYERGYVLTLQGRRLEALAPLDSAFRAGIPQAGYLLALDRLALGDALGAMVQFKLVAQRHADTLTGQKALANTTLGPDDRPLGAAFAGFEHIGYLPAAAYEGLPKDTSWAGKPRSPRAIAADGVRFLLSMQRSDGGFSDCRYAYWGSSKITPNAWVAITALAATALLEFRDITARECDPAATDVAIEKCEEYIFDPQHLNRGENEDVYADAYRIFYLTHVIHTQPKRARWARARAEEILRAGAPRQRESGFFAHEYPNAFCTAAMIWTLLEARDAGVKVPQEILTKGAAAIESARYENGAFSYGGTARGRGGSLKDAAGRMPLCESVLARLGKSSRERVEFALDNYRQYSDRIERVRRNDFHSDGELAGFFYSHNLMHTAALLTLVSAKKRAEFKSMLLRTVQTIAEMDGSFIDSHEFGRSYATAMALLALRSVVKF